MPLQPATLTVNRSDLQRTILFQLDTDHPTQRSILEKLSQNHLYEPDTTLLLSTLLQPGDGFLDIGAHVGFFSMLAAACVGPTGRVYAFEPDHTNYLHLLSHLTLNDLHNVLPFHWAVGEQSRIVDFYFNLDNDGGHALWDPGLHPEGRQSRAHVSKSQVFQVKLDDLFIGGAKPGAIKAIKIDVEGNEFHILRGAKNFLQAARIPAVITEINSFALAHLQSSERQIREFMTDLGYITYLLLFSKPTRLTPDQYLQSKYVFNLLFITPELQQIVAPLWPQSTSLEDALRARQEM